MRASCNTRSDFHLEKTDIVDSVSETYCKKRFS